MITIVGDNINDIGFQKSNFSWQFSCAPSYEKVDYKKVVNEKM